ncbi:ATP-binding cassette domain-containing protein [Coxiella burnetii]|uniref:ATP-binding cassette domain-containing protein n=3 Tax=Coxiella burnetii TaxID=777 RepID=UPI0028FC26B8|nr:ATP-binding cassette domain-containing protein [Coxiella burnetii]
MDDILNIKDYYLNQVLTNFLDLPFVILFIALMAYISTYIALIPVLMIFFLFFSSTRSPNELGKHVEIKHTEDGRRWSFLANIFSGSKTLKFMVSEPLMLRRYERLLNKSLEENKSIHHILSSVQGTSNLAQYSTLGLVILIGGAMLINGNLSMGALAASVLLAGRAIQPVRRMIALWQQYQSIPVAKKSLKTLESFPMETKGKLSDAAITKGDIVFDHVSFHYEKEKPLLEDINLHVSPGEIIGITGTNYSGKTTLLEFILGFHTPTKGEIRIDGKNIENYDKMILREKIAYLPARGQIFRGTLLENITMFRPERAKQALELSDHFGLSELIWPLPNGFDTTVGGGCSEILSRGVVQVVSTIRALISKPKILLSDEANALLDLKTDQLFLKILQSLKKTAR